MCLDCISHILVIKPVHVFITLKMLTLFLFCAFSTCSTLYQLWSEKSKPLLSEYFQKLSDLHQLEKDGVMGEWQPATVTVCPYVSLVSYHMTASGFHLDFDSKDSKILVLRNKGWRGRNRVR